MDKSKARALMLAASGVLFGASAFGWWLHTMPPQQQPTTSSSAVASAPLPAIEQPTVAVVTRPAAQAAEVYPATTREEAVAAARASVRQDPFSGLAASAPAHVVASRPALRHDFVPPPPEAKSIVPEPPDEWKRLHQTEGIIGCPPPPAEPARHDKLQVDDIRLVGLIDGKAIFRINRSVAADLNLPRAFTIGKGDTFANLKVDSIERDSAVVRDGTNIATKELGPVQ
jgi:hypothetical protein